MKAAAVRDEIGAAWAILVDRLIASPDNPRKTFDQVALEELASTMRNGGIVQVPLLVRKMAGEMYEIVCGHRRHAAPKPSRSAGRDALTENKLRVAAASLQRNLFDVGAYQGCKVTDGRGEFLAAIKRIGYDGSSAWLKAKPAAPKKPAKPTPKKAAKKTAARGARKAAKR